MCVSTITMVSKPPTTQKSGENPPISDPTFVASKKLLGNGVRRYMDGDGLPKRSIEYARALKNAVTNGMQVSKEPEKDSVEPNGINENVSITAVSRKAKMTSEITFSQFLDFLKTAYQVQDPVEKILLQTGNKAAVDWIKLKENNLVKPKTVSCQTSFVNVVPPKLIIEPDKHEPTRRKSESNIKVENSVVQKLHEVLSEGILDSVLPYLIPPKEATVQSRRPSQVKLSEKSSSSTISTISRRKSSDSSVKMLSLVDSEVEILVCDEVKETKKTFICSRKLLVEKMGYFADVTAGQRLEDMDISVHCDINIFEWLMRWVKRENTLEPEWPVLDIHCVVPVLVSAAFLQMEPLLEDCLLFVHENLNDILRTATNLSCLNDNVITRLAAMYTNQELEAIKDRKDKIQSRLFCKMIISLNEEIPETLRGHYSSTSRLYRCIKCEQVVSPSTGPEMPCQPPYMTLRRDGKLISSHIRDPAWSLSEYISGIYNTCKSWRRTYWKLWGDCHFLYCSTCQSYFPSNKVSWCCYHPDGAQFFTAEGQKNPLPVGRYPCCGERAYRFQLISVGMGCKFREHVVRIKSNRESAILALLETFRPLIELEAPELIFPERLTRLVARDPTVSSNEEDADMLQTKETFWWEGFELVPLRKRLGVLSLFVEKAANMTGAGGNVVIENPSAVTFEDSCSSWETVSSEVETYSSSSEFTDEGHSEESRPPSPKTVSRSRKSKRRYKKRGEIGRFWQQNLSARTNQDVQREFEELMFKRMCCMLTRRFGSGNKIANKWARFAPPPGGTYVRLETEWREANNIPIPPKLKNMYGAKYRYRSRYN